MKKLYAMLTNHCNLSCKHCTIKDAPECYNKNNFLNHIKEFSGHIILFGGEPTLYEDRLFEVIDVIKEYGDNKRIGITTNLIKLNKRLIDFYSTIKGLCTSWNYSRFTDYQYKIWLNNIDVLEFYNIHATVLITLTNDLISKPVDEFIQIISKWNNKVIENIKFEQCIDNSLGKDHYDKTDDWLCELFMKRDKISIDIDIFDKNNKWYFNCNDIYSLTPDGVIHNCCPNGLYNNRRVPNECLTCSISNKCRPCRLQQYCTRPIKLKYLIEREDL